jgi:serine/threonine protein kinase
MTVILSSRVGLDNHQSVAIKTVLRQKLSAKLFENLQSEIQILKSLSHRHITKLIDIVMCTLPSLEFNSIIRRTYQMRQYDTP